MSTYSVVDAGKHTTESKTRSGLLGGRHVYWLIDRWTAHSWPKTFRMCWTISTSNFFNLQVWLTVLSQTEAQRRLCERNNLSPEAASERLARQASAVAEVTGGYTWFEAGQYCSQKSPIDYAHVILSTEWDPECSQYQVEKSWKALQQRLELTTTTQWVFAITNLQFLIC